MYSSTQQVDDRWDDYFAKSDAIRERYASELEDIKAMERADRYEEEYRYRVTEAGYPDTLEGMDEYEAYWKRTLNYYEEQGL